MTALRGWGLPEQHLAVDALVAFVDGELTPHAYDRAASHLAHCQSCAAEATAQRQARAAVRAADAPAISSSLLHALRSIPTEAQLPDQPDQLAVNEDGQLVTLARHDRSPEPLGAGATLATAAPLGSTTPLGSGAPLGSKPAFSTAGRSPSGESQEVASDADVARTPQEFETPQVGQGRRTRQGASVVVSGLVLGALAFMNIPGEEQYAPATTGPMPLPGGGYGNSIIPATARLDIPFPMNAPERTVGTEQPEAEQTGAGQTEHGPRWQRPTAPDSAGDRPAVAGATTGQPGSLRATEWLGAPVGPIL